MARTKTLSVRETIARLGCTRTYIYDLLCEGKFQGAYKLGHAWRIPVTSVEQRLKEREARNG
jgi:excisionase family DNA binding protein